MLQSHKLQLVMRMLLLQTRGQGGAFQFPHLHSTSGSQCFSFGGFRRVR